jgi:hypothetical protein
MLEMGPIYEWQTTSVWVAGLVAGGTICLVIAFAVGIGFRLVRALPARLMRSVR